MFDWRGRFVDEIGHRSIRERGCCIVEGRGRRSVGHDDVAPGLTVRSPRPVYTA